MIIGVALHIQTLHSNIKLLSVEGKFYPNCSHNLQTRPRKGLQEENIQNTLTHRVNYERVSRRKRVYVTCEGNISASIYNFFSLKMNRIRF